MLLSHSNTASRYICRVSCGSRSLVHYTPHSRPFRRNNRKMGEASPVTFGPLPNKTPGYKPRYIDIGINLADPVYRGIHKDKNGNDKVVHKDDLHDVVERGVKSGCEKMIITGSCLRTSEDAVQLANEYKGQLYATVGIHPCSCNEIYKDDPKLFLSKLRTLALFAKDLNLGLAFGEIGLDYDRLYHADKETQIRSFELQLKLANELHLPLFLHSRAAHTDFVRLLKQYNPPKKGVVHSFTGTKEEMEELVEMGYDIGINGCSLKTAENCELVKGLDLKHLHLETDGPWCEMRPMHESSKYLDGYKDGYIWKKKEKWAEGDLVKGRNEPCMIGKVAWAVAGIKGVSLETVCEAAWGNTVRLFGLEGREEKVVQEEKEEEVDGKGKEVEA